MIKILPGLTVSLKKMLWKNKAYKTYVENGRKINDLLILENARKVLSDLILESKESYYMKLGHKLNYRNLRKKRYWSLIKTLFSGQKVPVFPPLYHNNTIVTDFKVKANMFNNIFSKQCSLLDTDSSLPDNLMPLTNDILDCFEINEEDVISIIQNLKSNKAHGHDNISIKMLKICDISISKPLTLLFKNCLAESVFPKIWKKANVVPIYKKGNKQEISNYRPVSLLPICGKIFERLIFNVLFQFITERKLLSLKQSGFQANDSCIHQLISITNCIYSSFDSNPTLEVRGVFLDISKAFDRVWHDGLLLKIKTFGVNGNIYGLIKSFLSDREQRVVLNGQNSDYTMISAGVPQGSILGPLLFLMYINDLPKDLRCDVKLFADDTCLFSVVNDKNNSATMLNSDLEKISNWAWQWKMSFNPDPLKQATQVLFSRRQKMENHPDLTFNGVTVKGVPNQKHLGLVLDSSLKFNEHIKLATGKAMKGIGLIRKLHQYLPRSSLLTIYKAFIRPHLDYGDVIYDQPSNTKFSNKIETIQYNCALAITGAIRGSSREKLYHELGLESLSQRRWVRRLCYFFKIRDLEKPTYLFDLVPKASHNYLTRNESIPSLFCRTNFHSDSFLPYSIKEWNQLPLEFRNASTYPLFRNNLVKNVRPSPKSLYGIHDPLGVKLLTRIRLGLSHLREHKFRHNFQDTINPLCDCSLELENTIHFFLRCQNFSTIRTTLQSELNKIDLSIFLRNDDIVVQVLLYGDPLFSFDKNKKILECTIDFIKKSGRFDEPLF